LQLKRNRYQPSIIFLSGEYDRVVSLLQRKAKSKLAESDRRLLAWAYLAEGNAFHDKAKLEESETLHRAALDKFDRASKVEPTAEALYNAGNVLFDLSILRPHGALEVMTRAAEILLLRAIRKNPAALSIERKFPDVHNNWANALCDLARGPRPQTGRPVPERSNGALRDC
jgi:tetratricopeptide (TPR) repeat protein